MKTITTIIGLGLVACAAWADSNQTVVVDSVHAITNVNRLTAYTVAPCPTLMLDTSKHLFPGQVAKVVLRIKTPGQDNRSYRIDLSESPGPIYTAAPSLLIPIGHKHPFTGFLAGQTVHVAFLREPDTKTGFVQMLPAMWTGECRVKKRRMRTNGSTVPTGARGRAPAVP